MYDIILQVLIILAAAVIAGEIFEQFKLPSVAGQLLSGLILGPSLLGVLSYNSMLNGISSIAIFFIVFLIGIEMDTGMLKKLKKALPLSVTSFIIPFLFEFLIMAYVAKLDVTTMFVVALATAIPSISIISVLVSKYSLLEKESGKVILSSVIISDIIAFVLLSAISGGANHVSYVVTSLLVFLILYFSVDYLINKNRKAIRSRLEVVWRKFKSGHFAYGALMILGFLVSTLFNLIGLSYLIGAFFAGLIINRGLIGGTAFGRVKRTLGRINDGFFIPIFFGTAGLEAGLSSGTFNFTLGILMIALAAFLASYALSYNLAGRFIAKKEANSKRKIAGITSGRGAVGIAIAVIALNSGLLGSDAYTAIIVATVIISVIVGIVLYGVA